MVKLKKYKGYIFLLPSLIGFMLLFVVPFVLGLKISFQKSGFNDTFVWFKNYGDLFESQSFLLAAKNNMIFMLIGIPLVIVISFLLSLAIYELKIPNIVKLAIILPITIPSASVAGFFRTVFASGMDNLIESNYAMIAVLLIYIWRSNGYNLLIYLAAMSQLDKSVVEASKIDGANYWQRLRHVIIPLLTPATFFVVIISIINSFKVFRDVYSLQGSYPNKSIYMLQHYMNNTFNKLQIEKLTASAYLFSLAVLVFALVLFYIEKRQAKS